MDGYCGGWMDGIPLFSPLDIVIHLRHLCVDGLELFRLRLEQYGSVGAGFLSLPHNLLAGGAR